MRKQTKIAAIVSAAALLAIGASMTSFAAGWVGSGTEYEYQDREGNAIEEEGWHRGESTWSEELASGYYFADDNGRMVFNSLIYYNDATYYVGDDGRRATNEWVKVEPEEGYYPMSDENLIYDTVYYYFGSTGKAVHSRLKDEDSQYKAYNLPKDNGVAETGKFVFDENGVMQVGVVRDVLDTNGDKNVTMYCARPDDRNFITLTKDVEWNYVTGQALTGWAYMDVESMLQEETIADAAYDDEEWFYFNGNQLFKAKEGEEIGLKNIKNVLYVFDQNGVLVDENVPINKGTVNNASLDVKVYANGGESVEGNQWVNYSGDNWYYIVNVRNETGKMLQQSVIFNSKTDNKASRMIGDGGARFMIGPDGKMITGAYEVTEADHTAWVEDAKKAFSDFDENDSTKNRGWNGTAKWYNIQYIIPTVVETNEAGSVTGRKIAEAGTWLYFNDTHDHDGDRGEQEVGKIPYTDDDGNTFTRFFIADGEVDGLAIYGEYLYKNGLLVTALDGDSYAAIDVAANLGDGQTEFKRYAIKSNRLSGSEPLLDKDPETKTIPGYDNPNKYVIVDSKGKVKRSSSSSQGLQIDTGIRYKIENYIATEK